jgi:hypothetical protein
VIHAELSEAVRQAVAIAHEDEDVHEVVERARAAFVDAHGVSLFALETDHPSLGTVHWIVGQPAGDEAGYMVLAIGSRCEIGQPLPLFAAEGEDLSEALRQLIPDCGMPAAA